MKEIWKDIDGYKGVYQVSNFGRVRSLDRTDIDSIGRTYCKKGRILKLRKNLYGYYTVSLLDHCSGKSCTVHSLVARTFINKYDKTLSINHIDGNKKNNNVNNLEIISRKGNIAHAIKTGLINQRGVNSVKAKFTINEIIKIRQEYERGGVTIKQISEKYGVVLSCIRNIVRYKTYTECDNINIKQNERKAKILNDEMINKIFEMRYVNHYTLIKISKLVGVKHQVVSSLLAGRTFKEKVKKQREKYGIVDFHKSSNEIRIENIKHHN